jgi:hypothetical protein
MGKALGLRLAGRHGVSVVAALVDLKMLLRIAVRATVFPATLP